MVYLDADNNLDEYGPLNIQQIQDGLTPGADVNVVVLLDRLDLPASLLEVTHDALREIGDSVEVDMGNPETLRSFLYSAITSYPAERYFLDVWDHGGGFKGVCRDSSSGNILTPHDVENAIALAETQTGKRIDVVGFDACLMGMVEVCDELSGVTDIVVGSELLIPGDGWPYTPLFSYISENSFADSSTLSKKLVDLYVAAYPKSFVQLSAVDEGSFPSFVGSLNNLSDALKDKVASYKGAISGARSSAQVGHVLGTGNFYYYADIYKFAHSVGQKTKDKKIIALSADLMGKLDAAVFYEKHSSQQGRLDSKLFGFTIYFPPNPQAYSASYEVNVPCFNEDSSWLEFLAAYYGS